MKHFFLSMSVKQNLSVSVFVHKCLMVLNDVEYATFKMFVTQMSNYLFVISFQLMFYKTLRFSLARPYVSYKTYVTKVFCIYKKLFCNRSQRTVKAWLKSNTVLYETFLSFYVSEAKPLCFSLCSQMFDGVERC